MAKREFEFIAKKHEQITGVPVAQLPQRYAIILKNIDIRLFIT